VNLPIRWTTGEYSLNNDIQLTGQSATAEFRAAIHALCANIYTRIADLVVNLSLAQPSMVAR
jgi:hypothetical protein